MGAFYSESVEIFCVVISVLTCSVHRRVFRRGGH